MHALPDGEIRILGCKYSVRRTFRDFLEHTHSFEVAVYNVLAMKILKTFRNVRRLYEAISVYPESVIHDSTHQKDTIRVRVL